MEVATNEDGTTGSLGRSSFMHDPNYAFAGISVDPEHQHRSLGSRLFEDLESVARSHGLRAIGTHPRFQDGPPGRPRSNEIRNPREDFALEPAEAYAGVENG